MGSQTSFQALEITRKECSSRHSQISLKLTIENTESTKKISVLCGSSIKEGKYTGVGNLTKGKFERVQSTVLSKPSLKISTFERHSTSTAKQGHSPCAEV